MLFNFWCVCVCVGRYRWEYFAACICKLRNRNDRSASVEVQIERQIMETNVLTKVISSNLFDFYLCVYVKFVVVSLLCCIFIELLFYHFEKNEREKYSIKISKRREKKICMTLLSKEQIFSFLHTRTYFSVSLLRLISWSDGGGVVIAYFQCLLFTNARALLLLFADGV